MTGTHPRARTRRVRRPSPLLPVRLLAVASALGLVVTLAAPAAARTPSHAAAELQPHPAAPAAAAGDWRALLRRAADAATTTAYEGELLLVTWLDGESRVETLQVRHTTGELVVRSRQQTVSMRRDSAGVADHEDGWYSPLPAVALASPEEGLELLADKYEVEVRRPDRLLDRQCDVVDVSRRADGVLRERLWLDRGSGLLLRRETYAEDGDLLRMAAYLSLDLSPMATPRVDDRASDRAARGGQPVPLQQRAQGIVAVDDGELAVLGAAGWTVPGELPGGYRAVEAYVVSARDSQPLQVVYRDGLYTVSVFQQRGRPDWASLPPGAEPAEDLGFSAYEWPDALPERMVWEAGGTTWSLVGDAPPAEFRRIARALPRPQEPGVAERLRRGLSRLWSWMSPW